MIDDLGIGAMRQVGMRLVCGLIVARATINLILTFASPHDGNWPVAALARLLAVYPCVIAVRQWTDAAARIAVCKTVVALAGLLLFVSEGQVWQTDLRLLFFALLAAATIVCDWRVLLAVTVAVWTTGPQALKNAAIVKKSSSAVFSLSGQVSELAEQTGLFRVSSDAPSRSEVRVNRPVPLTHFDGVAGHRAAAA